MCKYCEGKSDLILEPTIVESASAYIVLADKRYANELIISTNEGLISMVINYCPECGAKLVE